jgi:hypothetical protein
MKVLLFWKDINIAMHRYSKHKEKYKHCIGAAERGTVTALKRGLQTRHKVFRKQSNGSSSALRGSNHVVHWLTKDSKP